MTIDSIQSEDLVPYGNGEIILRNIISKRATHIPRKNIFTLDSKSFGIDELTIEKNAKGDIFLSEGVLSCGKNLYPFTRIKGIIRGGMLNSFEVTLEISEHSNLELEIRVQDSQALFKKFNELKSLEINNFEHTLMRDQINFVKDRLGLDRR
ncbi:MAG: hypothetical protein HOC53_02400 [Candidatus Nitrosopelagicus sp.]|nr:hypothetical protein [Candidatus Nitrosopelagicus sp.]MBT4454787.1 hypothetical protein [Candidatus Nitrosopelagicus sp.]MBT6646665.1 hypothetical protein [Nitrososphaerota archaeon]